MYRKKKMFLITCDVNKKLCWFPWCSFVWLPVCFFRDAIGPGHLYSAETLPHRQKCSGAIQWTGNFVSLSHTISVNQSYVQGSRFCLYFSLLSSSYWIWVTWHTIILIVAACKVLQRVNNLYSYKKCCHIIFAHHRYIILITICPDSVSGNQSPANVLMLYSYGAVFV